MATSIVHVARTGNANDRASNRGPISSRPTPATSDAASSNALHPAARGAPRDTGGAAASCAGVNARSSRGDGRAIHDRVQSQLVSRREDPRMREPGAPEHVLRAHPQHAKAVDDRVAEVDFARVVEI